MTQPALFAFEERPRCPVCASKRVTTEFRCAFAEPPIADFIRKYYGVDPRPLGQGQYQLDLCGDCDLLFQAWVGDSHMLSALYSDWISANVDPEAEPSYREDIGAILLSRDAHEIMSASSYLKVPLSSLKTLDYGMGWALWARIAHFLGCRSYGFDLASSRMEFAREHGVLTLEEREMPGQAFDFINTEQVFEHVTDPAGLVATLCAALKPGGILKISVPSGEQAGGVLSRLQRGEYDGNADEIMPVQPLEHINCYRRRSIEALARANGMSVVRPALRHRFAFLRRWGTIDLRRPKKVAKELVRPWYQYRNPRNLYVWLRKNP